MVCVCVCIYVYNEKTMHSHIIKLYTGNFFMPMYIVTERGRRCSFKWKHLTDYQDWQWHTVGAVEVCALAFWWYSALTVHSKSCDAILKSTKALVIIWLLLSFRLLAICILSALKSIYEQVNWLKASKSRTEFQLLEV